jgi:prophage regulatory protein
MDRLIRINAVMNMTGKSRSSIYSDIASGNFPDSIKIGARSVAWSESTISGWINSKIDAVKPKSKEELDHDELVEKALAAYSRKRLWVDEEI